MKLISKIDSGIARLFDGIMSMANIIICVMLLVGAFMRYVLQKDFYGMEELVLLVAFWMYFLGSAMASREETQVSADLVTSVVKSQKAKSILIVIKTMITLVLFFLMTRWAWLYVLWALKMKPTTPVHKIPMVIMYVSILLSFAFSTIYEVRNLCHACISVKNVFSEGEGVL